MHRTIPHSPRSTPSRRTRSSVALVAALLAGSTLGTAKTQAGQDALNTAANSDAPTMTVWEVDMSGRPPYRRTRIEVPVVDVAALETPAAGTTETTTVWEVVRRGKPPYSRRQVEVPVVDAAALETLEGGEVDAVEESAPHFRGRPPFRRHR
jgi:hypothetical protein